MKVKTLYLSIGMFVLAILFGLYSFSKISRALETSAAKVSVSTGDVSPTTMSIIQKEPIRFIACGDVLLGRGIEINLKRNKKSYDYAFEKVGDLLTKGDVVFANLEEPITQSNISMTDVKQGGKIILKNSVESFDALEKYGFNLLNLANNHIMDYYGKGLEDTTQLLDSKGVAHAGAGINLEEARKPALIEKKGVKIGLLGYTDMAEIIYKGNPNTSFMAGASKPGVAPRKIELIKEDIAKIKDTVDILIVSFHWGVEDSFNITEDQKEMAHILIDSGVDMILGHHTHQFQGIEFYNNKPIIYSMGNFLFDQNESENQEGFILDFLLEGDTLKELSAHPVRTVSKIYVDKLAGKDAQKLLDREQNLCKDLGTICSKVDDSLVFELSK